MKRPNIEIPLFLSFITAIIFGPCYCESESFFSKIVRLATGRVEKSDQHQDNSVLANVNVPRSNLSNRVEIPLVGLGVGNMQPEYVSAIISHGLQEDKNIRLIDTSFISRNEFLVAKGLVEGTNHMSESSGQRVLEVHVITKIWYTHLGYNRTIMSVNSSLESLREAIDHPRIELKVHIMLHWPRCYDEVPWMNCIEEEDNLPIEVKNTGPPPHIDKQNAWKESWRALEELNDDENNPVASIGVSNFHLNELEELTRTAKTIPHMIETDVWSLLYDPLLIEFCHKRNIHLIAHQLIENVILKAEAAPFAYHHLLSVANDISKTMQKKHLLSEDEQISASQVVLSWLVQHAISVIPRTTDLHHLHENSATSISNIPPMDDNQIQIVAHAVEALISGEDLTEDAFVTLTFHAKSKDIYLYWHDPEFGGEIEVAKIEKGKSFKESSHPGHVFRMYDSENQDNVEIFTVSGHYGDHRHIEL